MRRNSALAGGFAFATSNAPTRLTSSAREYIKAPVLSSSGAFTRVAVLLYPAFSRVHSSRGWRAAYFLCTLLVFSYIFFEVLDLDGSNLPFRYSVLERTAILEEITKDLAGTSSIDKTNIRAGFSALLTSALRDASSFRLTTYRTVSVFQTTRNHGYRITLPRSSPPDPYLPS